MTENAWAPDKPEPDLPKLMADIGGVIGVWPARWQFANTHSWVEGIARMADVAGVDHVGIGTDFEGGIHEVWSDYADLPVLADALLKQGFSPEESSKLLGGNYMRVWKRVVEARKA